MTANSVFGCASIAIRHVSYVPDLNIRRDATMHAISPDNSRPHLFQALNPGVDVKAAEFKAPASQTVLASAVGAVAQWAPAVPIDVVKVR